MTASVRHAALRLRWEMAAIPRADVFDPKSDVEWLLFSDRDSRHRFDFVTAPTVAAEINDCPPT